jgi:hypothetical protein
MPLIVVEKVSHAVAAAANRAGSPSGHTSGMNACTMPHRNGGGTAPPSDGGHAGALNSPGAVGAVNGAVPPPIVDLASARE